MNEFQEPQSKNFADSVQKKITDEQLVNDLIERLKSVGNLRDAYLPEAKRLLKLDEIKDQVAKEKLEKAISDLGY